MHITLSIEYYNVLTGEFINEKFQIIFNSTAGFIYVHNIEC
jgi:hypothetical protein